MIVYDDESEEKLKEYEDGEIPFNQTKTQSRKLSSSIFEILQSKKIIFFILFICLGIFMYFIFSSGSDNEIGGEKISEQMREIMKKNIEEQLKQKIKNEMKEQVKAEMEKEIKEKMQKEEKIKEKLKNQMEQKLKEQLRQQFNEKIIKMNKNDDKRQDKQFNQASKSEDNENIANEVAFIDAYVNKRNREENGRIYKQKMERQKRLRQESLKNPLKNIPKQQKQKNYQNQKKQPYDEKTVEPEKISPVQEKIHQMKYPFQRWDEENLEDKQTYAISLLNEQSRKNIKEVQYYRLNLLYNISEYKQELPLCVSVCGRSTKNTYMNMLKTVFAQKYTNYKVVFIDDSMNPDLIQSQREYISKNAKNIKITQIYNQNRQFSLKNRDVSIRNYCEEDDIVVDLDSDDSLIGVYVFKLINTMYQRYKQKWVVYFTCLTDSGFGKIGIMNSNQGPIPDKVFEEGSYRNSGLWKTSQLRTFRRKLYMKIDKNDYLDSMGNFYLEKADGFIHFSLIELAGKNHTLKIDEPLYYYRYFGVPREQNNPQKAIAYVAIRLLPPYQLLENLESKPKRKENFKISTEILIKMKRVQKTIDPDKRIAIPNQKYISEDFDFDQIEEDTMQQNYFIDIGQNQFEKQQMIKLLQKERKISKEVNQENDEDRRENWYDFIHENGLSYQSEDTYEDDEFNERNGFNSEENI